MTTFTLRRVGCMQMRILEACNISEYTLRDILVSAANAIADGSWSDGFAECQNPDTGRVIEMSLDHHYLDPTLFHLEMGCRPGTLVSGQVRCGHNLHMRAHPSCEH